MCPCTVGAATSFVCKGNVEMLLENYSSQCPINILSNQTRPDQMSPSCFLLKSVTAQTFCRVHLVCIFNHSKTCVSFKHMLQKLSVFFCSFMCSWNNGEVEMQTAVSHQPAVWVVVSLLCDPEHTIKHSHTLTIPCPPDSNWTTKGPTGRTPSKTQWGSDRTFLQGRVGDHLWWWFLDR